MSLIRHPFFMFEYDKKKDNKFAGRDLDPKNEMELRPDKERGQEAYYKGEKIKYLDYFGESCERFEKSERDWKSTRKTNALSFSGYGKGTLNKRGANG